MKAAYINEFGGADRIIYGDLPDPLLGAGQCLITTADSDEKVARAKALGADLVINYKGEDVSPAIKKFAPDGVNIWWGPLRQADFERAISHLSLNGRMIVIAGRDARTVFPVGPFYAKNCTVYGF